MKHIYIKLYANIKFTHITYTFIYKNSFSFCDGCIYIYNLTQGPIYKKFIDEAMKNPNAYTKPSLCSKSYELAKFGVHAEIYGEEKKYPSPPVRTFSLGNILEISINPYFTSKK